MFAIEANAALGWAVFFIGCFLFGMVLMRR